MVNVKHEDRKMQKNRFFKNPKKIKLNYGDSGLIVTREGRIELIHLTIMKKFIKNFVKKKKNESDFSRERIWYFGHLNFVLHKKSKNARMGKGKGMVDRKVMRIRRGVTLFEFIGVPLKKLYLLIPKLNRKLDIKLTYFKNNFRPYGL